MEKVKIGICDNEMLQVKYLERVVKKFLTERKIDHEVICSTNSGNFLKYAEKYDIVFLDIDMDEGDLDGVKIGQALREINMEVYVIYVTNYQQYMNKAQAAHYFYYILKSSRDDDLIEVLNEVLKYLFAKRKTLCFMTKEGKCDLTIKKINCFEIHKEGVTASTTTKEKYEILISDEELKKIAEKYNFYASHRAFLVNFENVKLIKNDFVRMINNEEIPLANRRTKEMKEEFIRFLCSKLY